MVFLSLVNMYIYKAWKFILLHPNNLIPGLFFHNWLAAKDVIFPSIFEVAFGSICNGNWYYSSRSGTPSNESEIKVCISLFLANTFT